MFGTCSVLGLFLGLSGPPEMPKTKYRLMPTFILYSLCVSLIIGRWFRHTHQRKKPDDAHVHFVLSLCFVDRSVAGTTHTNSKYHYDSFVYFILSLRFVDRWVVGSDTHQRKTLFPTFILYSRFASLTGSRNTCQVARKTTDDY